MELRRVWEHSAAQKRLNWSVRRVRHLQTRKLIAEYNPSNQKLDTLTAYPCQRPR